MNARPWILQRQGMRDMRFRNYESAFVESTRVAVPHIIVPPLAEAMARLEMERRVAA